MFVWHFCCPVFVLFEQTASDTSGIHHSWGSLAKEPQNGTGLVVVIVAWQVYTA